MSDSWLIGLATVVGLCIGSFLTVCVVRWPEDGSVLRPVSTCTGCRAKLRWVEKLPLASFFWQRGQCANCGIRISLQYPLMEVAGALIWAGVVYRWGLQPEAFRAGLFFTLLLGVAVADFRTYTIPDQFTVGGAAVGLALAPLAGGPSFGDGVLGSLLGFGLLWVVAMVGRRVFSREAMGGGDIKLLAMIGAFLGPAGATLTLFVGALMGSLIFGPVALRRRKLVPFGTFLALGGALVYGWGDLLVGWYLNAVGLR